MAVQKNLETSKLQLIVVKNAGQDGAEKLGPINFPNIVEAASDEALQAVGVALGSLQKKEVRRILRIDSNELKA